MRYFRDVFFCCVVLRRARVRHTLVSLLRSQSRKSLKLHGGKVLVAAAVRLAKRTATQVCRHLMPNGITLRRHNLNNCRLGRHAQHTINAAYLMGLPDILCDHETPGPASQPANQQRNTFISMAILRHPAGRARLLWIIFNYGRASARPHPRLRVLPRIPCHHIFHARSVAGTIGTRPRQRTEQEQKKNMPRNHLEPRKCRCSRFMHKCPGVIDVETTQPSVALCVRGGVSRRGVHTPQPNTQSTILHVSRMT